MKKVFLTLVLAFAGIFAANAQVWIGGAANATINKDVTHFAVSPEVGYCIPNTKWTIAIGANYGFYKGTETITVEPTIEGGEPTTQTNDLNFNYITLSPYVRYTICDIEKFIMFMDLTGDFGLKDCKGYRVGLQPGIAWMATKHWTAAFRFAFIGYNQLEGFEKLNNGNSLYGEKGFRFDFLGNTGPTFGLYYNF